MLRRLDDRWWRALELGFAIAKGHFLGEDGCWRLFRRLWVVVGWLSINPVRFHDFLRQADIDAAMAHRAKERIMRELLQEDSIASARDHWRKQASLDMVRNSPAGRRIP